MIPNDEPLRGQTIKRMIDHLTNPAVIATYDFTEWEAEFLSSIKDQFDAKGRLSLKQAEILERIYDK